VGPTVDGGGLGEVECSVVVVDGIVDWRVGLPVDGVGEVSGIGGVVVGASRGLVVDKMGDSVVAEIGCGVNWGDGLSVEVVVIWTKGVCVCRIVVGEVVGKGWLEEDTGAVVGEGVSCIVAGTVGKASADLSEDASADSWESASVAELLRMLSVADQ